MPSLAAALLTAFSLFFQFGEVGVDDALVKERFETTEDIFEMNNGCICCTVRGDLIRILSKLFRMKAKLDGIVIETTGLADPGPVAQTFFMDESMKEFARLDGIVTLVDAKHIEQHLDEEKPEGAENEAVEQVAFADRILLNKTDLVDEAELSPIEERLKKINPTAQIFRCEHSKVEPKNLVSINAFKLDKTLEMDPEFLNTDGEHEHDPRVSSTSTKFEGYLNVKKLNMWISTIIKEMGANLFRYKGVLSVAGMPNKFVCQHVGRLLPGDPHPRPQPRARAYPHPGLSSRVSACSSLATSSTPCGRPTRSERTVSSSSGQ